MIVCGFSAFPHFGNQGKHIAFGKKSRNIGGADKNGRCLSNPQGAAKVKNGFDRFACSGALHVEAQLVEVYADVAGNREYAILTQAGRTQKGILKRGAKPLIARGQGRFGSLCGKGAEDRIFKMEQSDISVRLDGFVKMGMQAFAENTIIVGKDDNGDVAIGITKVQRVAGKGVLLGQLLYQTIGIGIDWDIDGFVRVRHCAHVKTDA